MESKIQRFSFSEDAWKQALVQAYSFRFTETPEFKQTGDHITTAINPDHREGFDNISLLLPEPCTAGVKATLRCGFDGLGCPEIILVKKPEPCADGAVRYGECFEVVLWKNGVNVWRHFMDEQHTCSWHKRLGLHLSVSEGAIHELTVETAKESITFRVDGVGVELRTEDLFDTFYVGITACEGIVRLYDFVIEREDNTQSGGLL
jgi:hypothetical protein